MMETRITDITAISREVIAVTFEQEGDRDIPLFRHRVRQEDIASLRVYRPAPDDPVVQVNLEQELAEWVRAFANERGVTEEQVLRAVLVYMVKYAAEEWRQYREVSIPCKITENDGGKGDGE